VLTVYGGKITTYRRLAEAAMQRLTAALGHEHDGTWTGDEPLPGGDIPGGDLAAFTARCQARWPQLPRELIARLARLYGTRMARILGAANTMQELGRDFGARLTQAEVRYLMRQEWARAPADILWRRTRLGLMLPASAVHDLQDAVTQLLG
jgi:glycerol-3-phosphate dehydrogenase